MDNVGIDLGPNGQVRSQEEITNERRRNGLCETCGRKCFNKTLFKKIPITNPGLVENGRCLKCNPLQIASQKTVLPAEVIPINPRESHHSSRMIHPEKPRISARSVSYREPQRRHPSDIRQRRQSSSSLHFSKPHFDPTNFRSEDPPRSNSEPNQKSSSFSRAAVGAAAGNHLMKKFRKRRTGSNDDSNVHPSSVERSIRRDSPDVIQESGNQRNHSPSSLISDEHKQYSDSSQEHKATLNTGDSYNQHGNKPEHCQAFSSLSLSTFEEKKNKENFSTKISRDQSQRDSLISPQINHSASSTQEEDSSNNLSMEIAPKRSSSRKLTTSFAPEETFNSPRIMPSARDEEDALSELSKPNRTYESIIQAMKSSPKSLAVQKKACQALSSIKYTETEKASIANIGGINSIIIGMGLLPSCEVLQLHACQTLLTLSTLDTNQRIISKSGGIDAVASALEIFPDNLEIEEVSVALLACLASLDENKCLFVTRGIMKIITKAMERQSECFGIQNNGCIAIANVTFPNSSIECNMSKVECINCISIGMNMFPGSIELVQNSLKALRNLCSNRDGDENMSEGESLNVGGIDAVISAMQIHRDDASIQESGAWTIFNLGTNNSNKRFIGESGGIDVIIRAMWVHSTHLGVQKWSCRALWTLSFNPDNKAIIVEVGGVTAVINAMQGHQDSADIQEIGCRILSNLSANDNFQKINIVNEGALDAIVLAMVLHEENVDVLKRACSLVQTLAVSSNLKSIQAMNIPELMVEAARKFPEECKEEADLVSAMKGK